MKKLNIFLVLLLLCAGLFAKNYKADFKYKEYIETVEDVEITIEGRNYIITPINTDADTAYIFYPGGRVSYHAYLPLLVEISKQGIVCIMPKMVHNLAIYNIFCADKIIADPMFENIQNWYVGGHSLGGAMSCVYAKSNIDKLQGLILMAAYSTKDLSDSGLKVLSFFGTNDGVLKMANYEKYKANLPEDLIEVILDGGNHSGFGAYGFQNGDKEATISAEEQKMLTAQAIGRFL